MLAERPFLDGLTLMTALASSALRRFVTDGLRDTIASYTAGTLPLHRFTWELESRLTTLAELTGLPTWRTLAALRAAHRTIAELDTQLRAAARGELTPAERHVLAAALVTLRATLARLDPDDPMDPVDSAAPRPVVLTLLPRPPHHAADLHPALIA
jgi:hypothetical protein